MISRGNGPQRLTTYEDAIEVVLSVSSIASNPTSVTFSHYRLTHPLATPAKGAQIMCHYKYNLKMVQNSRRKVITEVTSPLTTLQYPVC